MKFSRKQKNYAKNASVLFLAASMAACSQGGGSGDEITEIADVVYFSTPQKTPD